MSVLRRSVLTLSLLAGCESYTLINEPLPPVDAGMSATDTPVTPPSTSTPTPRRDASVRPVDPDETEPLEPMLGDDGGLVEPSEPTEPTEPGEPGEPTEPMESKIAGSGLAAKCSSYGLPKNGMCAGYYCAITVDDLAAEFVLANSKCDTTPEKICDGALTRTVGRCARETKSNPLNALDSDEMIRGKVQTCVLAAPENANLKLDCLACFLDAAQCASDKCLTQCLTGDSATCDQCRLTNNCNQPVPTCTGFPTPF